MFNNDWDHALTFGKNAGKTLKECDESYIRWLLTATLSGPALGAKKAAVRIVNRVAVTRVVKERPPMRLRDIKFTENPVGTVTRPPNVNPQLFGAYIEMLVKRALGIDYLATAREYLSMFDLCQLRSGLVRNGPPEKPGKFQHDMFAALKRCAASPERCAASDIPLLSTAHALSMGFVPYATIQEFCALLNVPETQAHMCAFADFSAAILPKLAPDQTRCEKISVGAVIGIMDALRNCDDGTAEIIEIKCCVENDIEYWYNQTFVYACCYFLRYGQTVSGARVWNFLTGSEFYFKFNIDVALAKRTVANLCDLPEHREHLA